MNAVEIEEAISSLAEQPFDPQSFPYAFLEAFGNKPTTIKRLKSGSSNKSDLGGVLQTNNIHIAVCEDCAVTETLAALKASPATRKAKAKFILATDGTNLEAEDLTSGETIACGYNDFPNHFGFFLPLAGITTVKQIRNNPIDIQATGRLNRLYVELLKTNEEWASEERRHDMNQFMARLIFCFFAEDTDIFNGKNLFTSTIEQMSDSRSDNTDFVIGELFRAMDTKIEDRESAALPRWADAFPYVNGGLFAGSKDIPKFSRIARSYLLHAGNLNWQEINPDIFGSMIQAVADDDERGELGMHYTSVPNILKVLNPLFLDDLRGQLEQAGDNPRKLLNLRKRLANIRVFDPACGSGNFLVIAYIRMREIEAELLRRRGEANDRPWIKLENFYGIELKDFAAEIARLSLLIAEFQCDVRFMGQKEAKALVLPLRNSGQVHTANAMRIEWQTICPIKHPSGDQPIDQTEREQTEDVATEKRSETYLCGNPPYKGSQNQTPEQKKDLELAFDNGLKSIGTADYVMGWFVKGCRFLSDTKAKLAFVTTNSVHQGRAVAKFWPHLLGNDLEIHFAVPSFPWTNLASKKAAVTVSIIGITGLPHPRKTIFSEGIAQSVAAISPYLVANSQVFVKEHKNPISDLPPMIFGSMPNDGGGLLLNHDERRLATQEHHVQPQLLRKFLGTREVTNSLLRYCIWLHGENLDNFSGNKWLSKRLETVKRSRANSSRATTRKLADKPHLFGEIRQTGEESLIVISGVSSENREYLPVTIEEPGTIISNLAFALLDAPLWNLSVVASRLHLVWIGTVCGKMKTDFRYSNTLGWNTFPVPTLTEKNKSDLTRCAEDILLAREAHFPATIADLYDPDNMPNDLREAHDRNDEMLERIYIGRRFKNDTERLEKLFDLYTIMTATETADMRSAKKSKGKAS